VEEVRRYPGGPDDRAIAALRRYRESTGREPPVRLTVACSEGHTLAQVAQTTEGPVVTGRFTTTTLYRRDTEEGPSFVRRHGRPRQRDVAVLLDLLDDNQAIILQCSCRTRNRAEIRASWLRERLAAGRLRAVYALD
jgi:hypothetical protein